MSGDTELAASGRIARTGTLLCPACRTITTPAPGRRRSAATAPTVLCGHCGTVLVDAADAQARIATLITALRGLSTLRFAALLGLAETWVETHPPRRMRGQNWKRRTAPSPMT